jgi:cellulose biosynthesis protein BcsQ
MSGPKVIAFFNQKGGVGKTTTVFNLAWAMAKEKKRVLMVDLDPQCNLTRMSLEATGFLDMEDIYDSKRIQNVYSALKPTFESAPEAIKPAKLVELRNCKNLWLLPGHVDLQEFDVKLGLSINLSNSVGNINLPGAFNQFFQETAKEYKLDYILLDMSPAISSLNQILFLTSNYFLLPCTADIFNAQAVDSLSTRLPEWVRWKKDAEKRNIFDSAAYKLPEHLPIFLGVVIQRFNQWDERPTKDFQLWIDNIVKKVETQLVPELRKAEMLLPDKVQKKMAQDPLNLYVIAEIPDCSTPIAISQKHGVPLFALTAKQIGKKSASLDYVEKTIGRFEAVVNHIIHKIYIATSY